MLVNVNNENINLLEKFISLMGNSSKSFRYFNSRSINVIENHLSTVLLVLNDVPVGYGHLDLYEDKVWLGIAISESYTGKGFGKLIMEYLMDKVEELKISEVFLSVDKDNFQAIKLYQKFGFLQVEEKMNVLYFVKK